MQYTLEIEIDQPRSKIAELFGDPQNLAFWQPGFVSYEHLSGDEGKPGSKSRLLYKNRGRDVEMIETVEVDNLPDEFTATYEAKGMRIKVKNLFTEVAPDKTRWVSENESKVSGFMMRIISIIMPGCFKNESWKYMENFKAFAEDGSDVREKAK